MGRVTEIVTFSVKNPEALKDKSSEDYQRLYDTLKTSSSQPGALGLYHGMMVEDPSKVVLYINWDDISSHNNFMSSPIYTPFVARLSPIMSSELAMFHATFPSAPPSTVSAPVLETVTFYLPSDIDRSSAEEVIASFLSQIGSLPQELRPVEVADGWVVEEVEHEKSVETGKAARYVFSIGWESVEQHMRAREQEVFLEGIKPLRAIVLPPREGVVSMFHTSLTRFEA